MKPTKEVFFNLAEQEMIAHLEEMGGGPIEVRNYVIGYKRDMALHHKAQGNHALYRHIMEELGEWDDSLADLDPTADLQGRIDVDKEVKIIIK